MVTDFRFGMSLFQYFKLGFKKRNFFIYSHHFKNVVDSPILVIFLTKDRMQQTDTINVYDKIIEYRGIGQGPIKS